MSFFASTKTSFYPLFFRQSRELYQKPDVSYQLPSQGCQVKAARDVFFRQQPFTTFIVHIIDNYNIMDVYTCTFLVYILMLL